MPPTRIDTASRVPRASTVLRVAICIALAGCMMASGASAFAPDRGVVTEPAVVEAPARPAVDGVLRRAAGDEIAPKGTLMERISRKLRRIPLRPVMIGETPRTPEDPEPGAGITIFIRF